MRASARRRHGRGRHAQEVGSHELGDPERRRGAHVLETSLAALDGFDCAHRPVRIPVVSTPAEVAAVLGRLHGPAWLVASIQYGSGLRLIEAGRCA
ncbi:MAG: hypothetical protein IT373_23585 [Polyangiaceae bacterium]|nr:hypothetical protein [Polyangiaceae bacterium]